jgi:hypothetical protein
MAAEGRSERLSMTIILHVSVDGAQGAAPSDLSCFGGEAIAYVALEAAISVIGVDVDRLLLRLDRLGVAHRDVRAQLTEMQHGRDFRGLIGYGDLSIGRDQGRRRTRTATLPARLISSEFEIRILTTIYIDDIL